MKKTITALLAAATLSLAGPAAADAPPGLLAFYPQAGTLGEDVFVTNHVDLDPGAGVLDYACGRDTYDGHTGQDTAIRSFREVRIGVPVFAALDGRVLEVQYAVGGDFNWGPTVSRFDTHVMLQHGDLLTVYGHLKRSSVTLRKGQLVTAGQQIGLTASSGNSSWPHLHFTIRDTNEVFEPFAGPCRPGPSLWAEQPDVGRAPLVRNVTLSPKPFTGRRDLPYDEAPRSGTFVRGVRDVQLRIEVRDWAGGSGTVTVRRPDGSAAATLAAAAPSSRYGWLEQRLRLDLDRLGGWTIAYAVDGRTLVEAPFDVVASARAVRNRPPAAVTVALEPAAPRAGEVTVCRVGGPLAVRDPDYDVVRYLYRWRSGGRVLRSVTSAGRSDAIPRTAARAGETLSCTVTPSDGRLRGPAAAASATVG